MADYNALRDPAEVANNYLAIRRQQAQDAQAQQQQQFNNSLAMNQDARAQGAYDQTQHMAALKQNAQQIIAATSYVLGAPDGNAKSVVESQFPEFISQLQQQFGHDWSQISEQQVRDMATAIQAKTKASIGEVAPNRLVDVPLDGGAIGQRDPMTNALTVPYKPPEAGAPVAVVGADGKPTYVNKADAVGKRPYEKPSASVILNGSAGLQGGGLDLAAQTYLQTGTMPSGLSRVPGASLKIVERAAEMAAANGDTAKSAVLNRQAVSAGKAALSKLTTQKALVGAFEKTAAKNMDLAASLSSQIARTNSPLVNRGIMAFQQGVAGDPETAQFVNALIAARTEYAKVLSGATGAAGITDSARAEANHLFSTATSNETLQAVLKVAKQEMANRMTSFDDQIAEVTASTAGAPVPAAAAPEITATGKNGEKIVLRGGQWVPLK